MFQNIQALKTKPIVLEQHINSNIKSKTDALKKHFSKHPSFENIPLTRSSCSQPETNNQTHKTKRNHKHTAKTHRHTESLKKHQNTRKTKTKKPKTEEVQTRTRNRNGCPRSNNGKTNTKKTQKNHIFSQTRPV